MTWPTVTEQPLRLEPTSRDPFLDGLAGVIPSTFPRRPAAAGAGAALLIGHHSSEAAESRRSGLAAAEFQPAPANVNCAG
jgi:hypothetical protein